MLFFFVTILETSVRTRYNIAGGDHALRVYEKKRFALKWFYCLDPVCSSLFAADRPRQCRYKRTRRKRGEEIPEGQGRKRMTAQGAMTLRAHSARSFEGSRGPTASPDFNIVY